MTEPTVTIGGVTLPYTSVKYAGFVADSIAGLYQVNVLLPQNSGTFTNAAGATVTGPITVATQLPVTVSIANTGNTSQSGVNIWVTPKLNFTSPPSSVTGITGTTGVFMTTTIVAIEALNAGYHYVVTAGALPVGLTLNQTTGVLSGTPSSTSAGSYPITITASDSSTPPVTGSISFPITINAPLVVTGPTGWSAVFGTAASGSFTATGGLAPYTFATTSTLPTGMTLSGAGVLATTTSTKGGTFPMTVTATDSTSGTALTGSTTYLATVALNVTNGGACTLSKGSGGTCPAITVTGTNAGSTTYALDPTSAALNGLTVPGGVVTLAASSTPTNGTYTVTVTATEGTKNALSTGLASGTTTFQLTITN